MTGDRFEDIFEIVEDQATSDLRTCMPGTVESYDHDEQRASVKPVVDAAFINPETDEIERRSMPVVPNVPVAFPSAGSMQMTWPLEEGDTVLMLWSERSLDEWLTTGASRTQPSDNRRHDVSDAIALPQLRSFADAVEATGDNVVLNTDSGLEIHLGTPDPSQYVALADDVEGELESTRSTYNSHTHNYMVPASPAGTVPTQGPNQTRSSIGDVGADDVKAK